MTKKCPIHGDICPGDDGGFFIDGNHPDDMFSVQPEEKELTLKSKRGTVRFIPERKP